MANLWMVFDSIDFSFVFDLMLHYYLVLHMAVVLTHALAYLSRSYLTIQIRSRKVFFMYSWLGKYTLAITK